MIDIDVKSNIKEFKKDLAWYDKHAMPFISAMALTKTAQKIQDQLIKRVPRIFNVTKKWWLKRQPTGIKIKPARKGKHPVAEVYTKAHWANRQEEGGIKTPHTGDSILVPTSKVPKYGRKAGGAKRVISGKKAIWLNGSPIITLKSGKKVIARRKTKKCYPIEIMYWVKDRTMTKARWGFKATAKAQALRHFGRELKKAFEYEIRTRK